MDEDISVPGTPRGASYGVSNGMSGAAAEAPHEAVQAAASERLLRSALPPGWSVLGRCRFSTASPGPFATGCHALAHPEVGIALIDIAPDVTPNAESRLRRALSVVEFWPDFPGTRVFAIVG